MYHAEKTTKFLENLNTRKGTIWKATKRIINKTSNMPILINNNNVELRSNSEKADGFAKYFSSISNVCNDLGTRTFTSKVRNAVNKYVKTDVDVEEIKFCTYNEVVDCIKSLKSNKASGHDKISSKILKNLPKKAIVFLLKLINGMFITGHFPSRWKIAKVIPIAKKGKDNTN